MKISKEVRKQTVQKFTNLLDGKVRPGVSVNMILDFVEGLTPKMPMGNIEECFQEEMFRELEDDEEF